MRTRRIRIVADGRLEAGGFRIAGWPDAFAVDGELAPDETRITADVRIVDGRPSLRVR